MLGVKKILHPDLVFIGAKWKRLMKGFFPEKQKPFSEDLSERATPFFYNNIREYQNFLTGKRELPAYICIEISSDQDIEIAVIESIKKESESCAIILSGKGKSWIAESMLEKLPSVMPVQFYEDISLVDPNNVWYEIKRGLQIQQKLFAFHSKDIFSQKPQLFEKNGQTEARGSPRVENEFTVVVENPEYHYLTGIDFSLTGLAFEASRVTDKEFFSKVDVKEVGSTISDVKLFFDLDVTGIVEIIISELHVLRLRRNNDYWKAECFISEIDSSQKLILNFIHETLSIKDSARRFHN